MEVHYMLKAEKETIVTGVDFVNFYPLNVTVFIRYIKDGRAGEIVIDVEQINYLKIYND